LPFLLITDKITKYLLKNPARGGIPAIENKLKAKDIAQKGATSK
jgi:hypothetical protein